VRGDAVKRTAGIHDRRRTAVRQAPAWVIVTVAD
jgi:hypothetical protein